MGHIRWFEETKKPKQAIINKVLAGCKEFVVKSKWLEDGILVIIDGKIIEDENTGVRRLFIRNCRRHKPVWSNTYELYANDNPLDEKDCERYGLEW